MSSRVNRRPSRASKYHQQYLNFLRKWKTYVHASQYQECERLCLDHIDRIDRSIRTQIKQYAGRHNGATLAYTDSRFYDIKNYRSKVRNLYAVLLHDYLKQHNLAIDQYQLCVEDDEFNASAHYNWAILYKNYYKDYESAEVHYRRAIELKPNHPAYHNNYGLLLEHQLNRYDAAIKQFGIALNLDDKNGRAHTNMANILKKHYKDYDTAKMHYEKAIELDPQNATRHFNYALFLKHNLHDYTLAAKEYERAIALDPGYVQAHNEYKNFLLSGSPFHRNKYTVTSAEKMEHCQRCVLYALTLLWSTKKSKHRSDAVKDAREVMAMALKCVPNHPLALLVNSPYGTEVDIEALMDGVTARNSLAQKEKELSSLHSKMHTFHRRLSSIGNKMRERSNSMIAAQQQMQPQHQDANSGPMPRLIQSHTHGMTMKTIPSMRSTSGNTTETGSIVGSSVGSNMSPPNNMTSKNGTGTIQATGGRGDYDCPVQPMYRPPVSSTKSLSKNLSTCNIPHLFREGCEPVFVSDSIF